MATHSRILAWRIPCTEEPGGLQSTGSGLSDGTCQHDSSLQRDELCPVLGSRGWSQTVPRRRQVQSRADGSDDAADPKPAAQNGAPLLLGCLTTLKLILQVNICTVFGGELI